MGQIAEEWIKAFQRAGSLGTDNKFHGGRVMTFSFSSIPQLEVEASEGRTFHIEGTMLVHQGPDTPTTYYSLDHLVKWIP